MKFELFLMGLALSANLSYAQGYYPLQTGNLWQYSDYYDSSYAFTTKAMGDTSMPNGITYLHLRSDHELFDQYFRQAGSKVYGYSTSEQLEELCYDFSKTTLDTVAIHYYPTDTSTVVVAYDRMRNIFGRSRRQWGFYESYRHTSFYVLWEVTDSIGLTYYTYEPGIIVDGLRGANINGTTYGTITGVEETNPFHAAEFQLFQNYPNPFNSSTDINFRIANEHVVVTIFDILGREVKQLFEGRGYAGLYHLSWDGRNDFGVEVGSGTYLYRLQTRHFTDTKKMILMH